MSVRSYIFVKFCDIFDIYVNLLILKYFDDLEDHGGGEELCDKNLSTLKAMEEVKNWAITKMRNSIGIILSPKLASWMIDDHDEDVGS